MAYCRICGEPSDYPLQINPFQEHTCDLCFSWLGTILEYRRQKLLKACDGDIFFAALLDYIDDRKELFN